MEWMESLSPTLKLGLTLLAIVTLMRYKVLMGAALLLGAVFLAVLFPMSPLRLAKAAGWGLANEQTVFLLIIVSGLLVFSSALNETGQIRRIIEAFRALVGASRLTMVTFPALIGLLPMPGGAMFSAPMVKAAVEGTDISPARVTAANYWFRHLWELWFPIYPGVILALTLTKLPTGSFILLQLPVSVCSLALGYFFILRAIRLEGEKRRDYTAENVGRFVRELMPILIVVAVVVFLDPLAGWAGSALGTESVLVLRFPILLALVLSGAWLFAYRGLTWRVLWRLTATKQILSMLFLVVGLMVFQEVLDRGGAVAALQSEFEENHIPLLIIICALPLVAGLVVGIAVGFVGVSFPLVILLVNEFVPLAEGSFPASDRLPYYTLAYTMGYVGMMLSPVHLCLVITSEYFKAQMWRVYLYLIPLGLLLGAFGFLVYFVQSAFRVVG